MRESEWGAVTSLGHSTSAAVRYSFSHLFMHKAYQSVDSQLTGIQVISIHNISFTVNLSFACPYFRMQVLQTVTPIYN